MAAISVAAYVWREELSFRIQVVLGVATFALGYLVHLSATEWLFVVIMTGAVLSTEALNTAIEEICDFLISEHHPQIAKIKDIGALASALIGCTALVIGLIIFVPKITSLL